MKPLLSNIHINKRVIYISVCILIILAVISGLMYYYNSVRILSYKYFYKGVFIDGVNVAGLTKPEALELLENEINNNFRKTSIDLFYEDKKWTISLEAIEFKFEFDKALDSAFKLGHSGDWLSRMKTIRQLKDTPINLIVTGSYNNVKLIKILSKIKKQIDFLPTNSTYEFNYGKILYTKDSDGRKLDIETNVKLIEARLLNRDFSDICLDVNLIKPAVTVEDVRELRDVIGVFTTKFNANNSSRAHNIELAAKKINNYLLLPGEEFSMDRALGPRSSSNGYMQAPIISQNQIVAGTGGGICQVATTLYNAVLLSYLDVTKRVHHSLPLRYVPPGQDATISEGYIDLKFKNNRDYTICIVSEVRGGYITVKIVGRKNTGETFNSVIRPVVVEEFNPPEPEYIINNGLSDNQVKVKVKERKGLKVIVYRDSYNSRGQLTNSEVISEDIYKPVRGQLAVNRKTYDSLKNN